MVGEWHYCRRKKTKEPEYACPLLCRNHAESSFAYTNMRVRIWRYYNQNTIFIGSVSIPVIPAWIGSTVKLD